ncbi:uncharacterized protein LOC115310708, partial [Ixodes scapularis]|uniref:uncharacterized protein LOC115310708 n=1 Tax=Ixodes scapularis TaxID=6945 RepID=UPI001A9DD08E
GAREYPAERRQAMLLNCLGEAGQQIYDPLPTPEPAVDQALAPLAAAGGEQGVRATSDVYKETIKLLEAEFTQPTNVTLRELQFHSRRQRECESLQDFLSALRTLAVQANFGSRTQDCIRKQFMIGVASTEIQERMVLDAALPFNVVMQTIMKLERSRREAREWANATASISSGQTCQVTETSASRVKARRLSGERQFEGRRGHSPESTLRQTSHQSSHPQHSYYKSSPSSIHRASSRPSARPGAISSDTYTARGLEPCVTCGGSGRNPYSCRQQRHGQASDHRRDFKVQSNLPRDGSQNLQASRQPDNFRRNRICTNCGNGPHKCQSYDTCPARQKYCFNCGRRGHLDRVCVEIVSDPNASKWRTSSQIAMPTTMTIMTPTLYVTLVNLRRRESTLVSRSLERQ